MSALLPLLVLGVACGGEVVVAPVLLPEQDVVLAPAAAPPEAPSLADEFAQLAVAPPPSSERAEAFVALRPKSVVELQQWREAATVQLPDADSPRLTATFLDLNPWVHEWYLVQLAWAGGVAKTYHIENHDPASVIVDLDPAFPEGLTLQVGGEIERCPLWSTEASELELARSSGRIYAPICGGRLALRSAAQGRRSAREATVDFLRDKVWGGEQLTNLVKETLYKDSELATSEVMAGDGGGQEGPAGQPLFPRVDPAVAGQRLVPVNLGLPLVGADVGTVELGRWYPVESSPGVFVSTLEPRLVDPALTQAWGTMVHPLDPVEASALVFMTAFDIGGHELRFDQGTDHVRVGWSERAPAAVRDARLPGPDGFNTLDPLVRTGKVNPATVPRLVATFTGGFKRSHGAFRSGPFSAINRASHYGWVEHGVVESRPMPGLATLVGWQDGGVDLRVWDEADDADLWKARVLRQNGPPILVPGADGAMVPGPLVTSWSHGNWSGSVEGSLRSVRASLCVQQSEAGTFLLYGYFSSATPSAMARVLAAYGCGVAMLTDMNALEHTYLTLHHFHDGEYTVHHLINGMEVLDRLGPGGVYLPRFVGLADNRDFFTLLRRVEGEGP